MLADLPAKAKLPVERMDIGGVELELFRGGSGRPVLFLHPEMGLDRSGPFLRRAQTLGEIFAPSHPGFDGSVRPDYLRSVEDISYIYLDLIEQLDLRDILLVGSALGAWIAQSIAVKGSDRISGLVLAGPVGVRFATRPDEVEIANIFMLSDEEYDRLAFADPSAFNRQLAGLPFEEARRLASNHDVTALVGWLPYMHDPALRRRLHRIKVPTLLVHGEADGVVSETYVYAIATELGNATVRGLPGAGHYPEIEKPGELVSMIAEFAGRRDADTEPSPAAIHS